MNGRIWCGALDVVSVFLGVPDTARTPQGPGICGGDATVNFSHVGKVETPILATDKVAIEFVDVDPNFRF